MSTKLCAIDQRRLLRERDGEANPSRLANLDQLALWTFADRLWLVCVTNPDLSVAVRNVRDKSLGCRSKTVVL